MKNIKKILIGLTLLSQAIFAYDDIDSESWEGKAVNQLYEKGILTPALMEEESFEGEKTFSRLEVASLLYNTIKYNNEQLKNNVDVQDIIILKALVSEYGNELGELGAKNEELKKELQNLEDRINNRIDERFFELKEEMDRVRVNGDLTLEKVIKDADNPEEGYGEFEAEGEINILTKVNDDIKAEFKFDPEEGLESYELRFEDENLELIVFEDESDNKRLPTFKSTIGILDGDVVDIEDAAIAKGVFGGKDYVAVLGSSTAGDIFALEWSGKYNYFDSKEGTSSDMALAYSILDNADNGEKKEIVSFAPNFSFTLSERTKSYMDFEYASINVSDELDLDGDSTEYTLPAEDTSAFMLYNKIETVLGKNGSKRSLTFAGLNTGVNFDIDGIGDTEKEPFRETDLVKTEANMMGAVMGAEYNSTELNSSFYYSSYGSNDASDEKEQRYEISNIYSPRRKNYKLGLDLLQDKSYDYNSDDDDESLYQRYIAIPQIYLNDLLKKDSENKLMYAVIQNEDLNKESWEVYADHTQFLDMDKSVKYVTQYYDNREDESTDFEFAWNFERKNMKIGEGIKEKPTDIIIGGRLSNLAYDTSNLDDERSARIFFAQKIYYRHWTLFYGLKYQYTQERETASSSLEELDDSDNLKAGFEAEYDLSENVKVSFSYGPAEIYETDDEDEFLYDRTSAFDGEQNQATFEISAEF